MKTKKQKTNNLINVNKLTCKVVTDNYNKTVIFDTYVKVKDSKRFKICKRYKFDRFDNITNTEVINNDLIPVIKDRLNDTYKDFNFSITNIFIK